MVYIIILEVIVYILIKKTDLKVLVLTIAKIQNIIVGIISKIIKKNMILGGE